MTPPGIEPATFRFVAQHSNYYATAVPPRHTHTHTHIYIYIYVCVCECVCVCHRLCSSGKRLFFLEAHKTHKYTLCADTAFLMCQMDGKYSKYCYLKGIATPMESVNQNIIPKHSVVSIFLSKHTHLLP